MLEDLTLTAKKSSTERKNNCKRTKVFDPCISNKKKKMDNEFDSDLNSAPLPYDHLSIIRKHLLSSARADLNRTMDEMCSELGLHKYKSDDDLSDDSEIDSKDASQNNDSVKHCIDKIFEGLDDYAPFNPKGLGSTPKIESRVYSAIDSSIKPTPGILSSISCHKSILKPSSHSNLVKLRDDLSSTPRPDIISVTVTCSQSQDNHKSRSPLVDKTNMLTPEPTRNLLNGLLTSPRISASSSVNTLVRDTFYTPLRSTRRFISKKSLSPGMIELSPNIKKTLLIGVACYVDVKTNKEDCSSSVALELSSMGAAVEKTFNKKVTHVVFKEGKPSTFTKAKKLGIPMVSVLWLEACKKERIMVDPSLYPPINVEKYENLSPNAKKIPSLKTIQRKLRKHLLREAGLLSEDNKEKVRINWRNALTDIKLRQSSSQENSQGRLCIKKLNFNDVVEVNKLSQKSIETISDSPVCKLIQDENLNNDISVNSSDYHVSPPNTRRNSAPGVLVSERKKRKRKEEALPMTESQKMLTINQLFAKQMLLNQNKKMKMCSDKENDETCNSQVARKRKLFNPDEAIIIIDTPDEKSTPPPVKYDFPYKDEVSTLRKTSRTKSTSMKKIFKKIIVNKKPAAKKSLTSLLEQNESRTSSFSSLSNFTDDKQVARKMPKEPPTIVCTSLLPEHVRKVAYIVGKIGVFDLEDKVSSRTTHLVTSAPRRTINLLKALVRGAWILHIDWIYKSEKAGHWLNEEEFELKTFSHAVTEMRRERQAFGPEFCSELFSTCGPIYISKRSVPPCTDLTELVRLCKGHIVNSARNAEFIIGGKAIEGETGIRLKEKWILDSITQNNLLDTSRYIIKAKVS